MPLDAARLSKKKQRLATEVEFQTVAFLGEQDGPVERTLKANWLPTLSAHAEIRRAFLVRAMYEKRAEVHVVLALCSSGRVDLMTFIEALRVPYAAAFSRACHLDMAFVTAAQESEIERVCRPFYIAV